MKTFIYKVDKSSPLRGYNRTITVFRMMRNYPRVIGRDNQINTAASCGDVGSAKRIIQLHGDVDPVIESINIYEV